MKRRDIIREAVARTLHEMMGGGVNEQEIRQAVRSCQMDLSPLVQVLSKVDPTDERFLRRHVEEYIIEGIMSDMNAHQIH